MLECRQAHYWMSLISAFITDKRYHVASNRTPWISWWNTLSLVEWMGRNCTSSSLSLLLRDLELLLVWFVLVRKHQQPLYIEFQSKLELLRRYVECIVTRPPGLILIKSVYIRITIHHCFLLWIWAALACHLTQLFCGWVCGRNSPILQV